MRGLPSLVNGAGMDTIISLIGEGKRGRVLVRATSSQTIENPEGRRECAVEPPSLMDVGCRA